MNINKKFFFKFKKPNLIKLLKYFNLINLNDYY